MIKHVVGIDPGNSGAIYVLKNGVKIFSTTYPKLPSGDIDRRKLFKVFLKLRKLENVVFVIEKVHAMFNSSAAATFSFGRAVEMVDTMVDLMKVRYFHVTPKDWQKEVWSGTKAIYKPKKTPKPLTKEEIIDGKKPRKSKEVVDTKKTSDMVAMKIFPKDDYRDNYKTEKSKKRHDGLIDASLIAWYGHLKGY